MKSKLKVWFKVSIKHWIDSTLQTLTALGSPAGWERTALVGVRHIWDRRGQRDDWGSAQLLCSRRGYYSHIRKDLLSAALLPEGLLQSQQIGIAPPVGLSQPGLLRAQGWGEKHPGLDQPSLS